MIREVWALLGWSVHAGLAVVPVGVVGLEAGDVFVEWIPQEYEATALWRERLTTTSADDLHQAMRLWQDTPVAPAALLESLLSTAALADDVRAQVDDILANAR